MGGHCIKTWSCTQGAFALSSAEAEFYAMIEAVVRSKGLKSLARELGFRRISNVVVLGTDSSAAKSFVCRRGLGKMRHIEIRDLWLQKEVREGRLKVVKVLGSENPADLMTKILNIGEIEERLKRMNLMMVRKGNGGMNRLTGREDEDLRMMRRSDGVMNKLTGREDNDGEEHGPWICAVVSDSGHEMHSETKDRCDEGDFDGTVWTDYNGQDFEISAFNYRGDVKVQEEGGGAVFGTCPEGVVSSSAGRLSGYATSRQLQRGNLGRCYHSWELKRPSTPC